MEGKDDKTQSIKSGSKKLTPIVLKEDSLKAVQNFTDEINRALPPALKEKISQHPVRLIFAKLMRQETISGSDFEPGPQENKCLYPQTEDEAKDISNRIEKKNFSILASTRSNGLLIDQTRNAVIILDSAWLPHILRADKNSEDFECFHKNFYRAAQGEIFRNLGRIFDEEMKVSKEKPYKTLAAYSTPGWFRRIFTGKSKPKAKFKVRTPDAREFLSYQQHFWINVEYFLTDPQYRCRRPAHYAYFARKLGRNKGEAGFRRSDLFHPFSHSLNRGVQAQCRVNTQLPIVDTARSSDGKVYKEVFRTDIGPNFVHRVDSNLAGSGGGLMSNFGHSMVRIAVCETNTATYSEIAAFPEIYDSFGIKIHDPTLSEEEILKSAIVESPLSDGSGFSGKYTVLTMSKYYNKEGNLIPFQKLPPKLICKRAQAGERGDGTTRSHRRNAVLSYRANVNDLMINNIKGLVGGNKGYTSQAFMFTEPHIMNEYNVDQLRDIFFIPIDFDRFGRSDESQEFNKDIFLYNTLTRYWQYYGSYGFIFNNCAGEQWDLIQASLPFGGEDLHKEESIFPKGVEKKMRALGLLDQTISQKLDSAKEVRKRLLKGKFPVSIHSLQMDKLETFVGRALSRTEFNNIVDVAELGDYMSPSNLGFIQHHVDKLVEGNDSTVRLSPFGQALQEVTNLNPHTLTASQLVKSAAEEDEDLKIDGKLTTRERYIILGRTIEIMQEREIKPRSFKATIGRLYQIESQIFSKAKRDAFTAIFKEIEGLRKKVRKAQQQSQFSVAQGYERYLDGIEKQIAPHLEMFDQLKWDMMPWRFVKNGYGIPLPDEVAIEDDKPVRIDKILREANQKMDDVINSFIKWGAQEGVREQLNLDELFEFTRIDVLKNYMLALYYGNDFPEQTLVRAFAENPSTD